MQSQDRVDVVATGFGAAHGDIDMVPREGGGTDTDTFLEAFLAKIGAPFPGGNGNMRFQHVGPDAHAFRSIECERPQVGAGQSVFLHNGNLGVVQSLGVVGNFHTEDMGRPEKSVGMVLKTKDSGPPVRLIGAHPLEDA